MSGKHIKVSCPCCRNGRLFDVVIEKGAGQTEVDIKCPACRNVIRIMISNSEIYAEQMNGFNSQAG